MQKITPFLWFDNQAEEAMNFYTSIFKNSKIGNVSRYGEAGPGPKGSVMTATFELEGHEFTALNGGPHFKFTEAISLYVNCESQEEVDYFWSKLSEGGQDSAMRLAQGQVRPLVADHPVRPAEADGRPGSGEGEPGHAGHAADEEDRHRQAGAGGRGINQDTRDAFATPRVGARRRAVLASPYVTPGSPVGNNLC